MQKSKNTGKKYKINLRTVKNISVIDFLMLIVAVILTVAVFILTMLKIFDVSGNKQIDEDSFKVNELTKKVNDTVLYSNYNVNLVNDNMIVDVSDIALNLRNYSVKLNLKDFENSINTVTNKSIYNNDSSDVLKLYTVDDFDEYAYVTYTNSDETKFVELAIFSDFPENFDLSVFGISDEALSDNKDDEVADANHSAQEVDSSSIASSEETDISSDHSTQTAESSKPTISDKDYKNICITNTIAVKSGDTYMALTNLYDQGYMFISLTGFDNIPVVKDDMATGENALSSLGDDASDEDINRYKTGELLRNLEDSLEWSRVDSDKKINIAGLGEYTVSDFETLTDNDDDTCQKESLFYSSKDGLIRICDSESSKVYFRMGSVTNLNTGMNLNKLVETDYPNVYKDINFGSESETGYGVMTVMTDSGMYVFKASDEVYSIEDISNKLINWLGITVDDKKIITSNYVMNELSEVMDTDKIDELENELNTESN